MTIGIYKIQAPSGNCYIGQSLDCERRFTQHKKYLQHGRHHNPALQRSWVKHNHNLTFDIVDVCSPENLNKLEQLHINALFPKTYNMQKVTTQGQESLELKLKRSITTKAALARPEVKANVAKAIKLKTSKPGWCDKWKATNHKRSEDIGVERLKIAGVLLLSDSELNILYNRYKNKRVVLSSIYTQEQTRAAYLLVRTRRNHVS